MEHVSITTQGQAAAHKAPPCWSEIYEVESQINFRRLIMRDVVAEIFGEGKGAELLQAKVEQEAEECFAMLARLYGVKNL